MLSKNPVSNSITSRTDTRKEKEDGRKKEDSKKSEVGMRE